MKIETTEYEHYVNNGFQALGERFYGSSTWHQGKPTAIEALAVVTSTGKHLGLVRVVKCGSDDDTSHGKNPAVIICAKSAVTVEAHQYETVEELREAIKALVASYLLDLDIDP